MKSKFLFFIAFVSITRLYSQKIQHQIIDVAGASFSANGYTMTASIGQTATTTLKNSIIITQGFQQPEFSKTISAKQAQSVDFQASIFPNPTSELLQIALSGKIEGSFQLLIFNMNGQLLKKEKFEGDTFQLNVSGFAVGQYIIRLQNSDNQCFMTAKFIKI